MGDRQNEDCAVCWRSFSQTLIPYSIPCGHSFCSECCNNLVRCPLCRKRLCSNYQRVKNFALLSLIDRISTAKVAHKDQQIQTDHQVSARKPRQEKHQQQMTPEQMLAKPLGLKFFKDNQGNIRRFEVRFK